MRRKLLWAMALAAGVLLALPGAAFAQDPTLEDTISSVNTTWVVVAAILVMFMQAGFAFLEIGFSRGKNAGAGVAKILVNFSIATIAWWADRKSTRLNSSHLVISYAVFCLKKKKKKK